MPGVAAPRPLGKGREEPLGPSRQPSALQEPTLSSVVANTIQPISASVILGVSEDEPDLASLARLEGAVDDGDITPIIGCELLHE